MADSAGRPEYWRGLEELTGAEAFAEAARDEFLSGVVEPDLPTRRRFLTLAGAGLGLAALAGCGRPPREKILPYVRRPEEVLPGRPLFYATAMTLGGFATGLLVESHEGRPIKVEGNPDHPSSRGATDAYAQAAVLDLYDPDRSRAVTYLGRPASWDSALEALHGVARRQRESGGKGLRILTETVTSPTFGRLIAELSERYPEMRWHQYEPVNRDEIVAGARLAFGEDVHTVYRYRDADVIVSLDADFLHEGPDRLVAAREFAARRRVEEPDRTALTRLYVVESSYTITGAKADHRLPLPARRVERFARFLAGRVVAALRENGQSEDQATLGLLDRLSKDADGLSDAEKRWAAAVARDLTGANRSGKTLLIAGLHQPAPVHALCHVLNRALGNVGKTLAYVEPVEVRPTIQGLSLRELVRDMQDGKVETLLIPGGNPVYCAPADLDFAAAMDRVPLRFRLGLYQDETSRLCHWHLPETHFLESWGDCRCHDGTAAVQQPLIDPLHEGSRSSLEVLAALSDNPARSAHDLVRAHWREVRNKEGDNSDFDSFWNQSLHNGIIPDSASTSIEPALRREWPEEARPPETPPGAEIVFRPAPTLYDGRFANNRWLQELPGPMTRLAWDNAALMSFATAERLGVSPNLGGLAPDLHAPETATVLLRLPGREAVEAPVWIIPGHPDDSVTVHLGYGRTRAGRAGTGIGFDAYRLRASNSPWFEGGLAVKRTGRRVSLASVQYHHLTENRGLVRRAEPDADGRVHLLPEDHHGHPPEGHGGGKHAPMSLSLYPEKEYRGYKWGMVIDLTTCIGCSACVVACQAENNIPTVGREEVLRGREMHWIRIDRYFADVERRAQSAEREDNESLRAPRSALHVESVHFQPVPCMHCEQAPCEPVCPVAATVHSDEGLNDMVYNRCVGTRYCSNNCPYKVRRFNFFEYADWGSETLRLGRNPDVTVRSRGVMEKCTYCVQRINAARIDAEKRGDRIRDGEVLTACQAACPASAITFGDLNDPSSAVAKAHASPLNYGLLADLNTQPRTTYLAEVRNPNPDPDLRA